MAKKPAKKSTRKVKDLKAKKVSPDKARRVKGGFFDIKGESQHDTHSDWVVK